MNLELRHKIILEILISVILFVFYGMLYLNVGSLVEQTFLAALDPVFFPKVIITCILVMNFMLVIDSVMMWHNYKNDKITHHMKTLVTDAEEEYPMGRVFVYIGTLFLYLIGFYYVGFVYATPIIILIVAYLLGMKNMFIGAIVAISFTLALDYASLQFLQILLPSGVLFE